MNSARDTGQKKKSQNTKRKTQNTIQTLPKSTARLKA